MNNHEEKPMIRRFDSRFWSGDLKNFLRSYNWIDSFQKAKSLQAELSELKKKLKAAKNLSITQAELLKLAKKFYEEYRAERTQEIQKALKDCHIGGNPFLKLSGLGQLRGHRFGSIFFKGFIEWPEIEAAVKSMPDHGVEEKDRIVAVNHIEKRIAELEKQLDEVFPKDSPYRKYGVPDVRDEFVKLWIKVQKECDGSASPFGIALKHSREAEKLAHVRLKIDTFISPDAPFRPRDPYT